MDYVDYSRINVQDDTSSIEYQIKKMCIAIQYKKIEFVESW
jgi:hypothetical protein